MTVPSRLPGRPGRARSRPTGRVSGSARRALVVRWVVRWVVPWVVPRVVPRVALVGVATAALALGACSNDPTTPAAASGLDTRPAVTVAPSGPAASAVVTPAPGPTLPGAGGTGEEQPDVAAAQRAADSAMSWVGQAYRQLVRDGEVSDVGLRQLAGAYDGRALRAETDVVPPVRAGRVRAVEQPA